MLFSCLRGMRVVSTTGWNSSAKDWRPEFCSASPDMRFVDFPRCRCQKPLDLLKVASDVPPPRRHYFVLFEGGSARVSYVQPRRLGTLTEIESLGRWLDQNPEIRSLLIISSSTHLRRLRICCRSLLRENVRIRLVAPPDSSSPTSKQRQSTMQLTRASLVELLKVLLYWALLALRRRRRPPSDRVSTPPES